MSTEGNALGTRAARPSYVEFEERASEIYLEFARRFRDNTELSWFWLGMSMAEKQHAVVLAFCECQQSLGENSSTDSTDNRSLSELFRKLEDRVAQPDLSIDDAFLVAAELETSEINAIYERIVLPTVGTSYLTRKKIETLGANHPQIIVEAARKFGVSAPVIEKLAQLEHQ